MLKMTENITNSTVPIITDVVRNIDGYEIVRCSYLSLHSDGPNPNWSLNIDGLQSQILLVNLEAIVIGSLKDGSHFHSLSDIEQLYAFAENNEGLFVDINEIWVPFDWLGKKTIEQGLLFRIPVEYFSMCWKYTNGSISSQELFEEELTLRKESNIDSIVSFSEQETEAFNTWTKKQIDESIEIYQSNRKDYLAKISEK